MSYKSLEDCLLDLERNKYLVRVREEVDPHLEAASIHMRVFDNNGPAILFENIKGSKFRAASNIFGSLERSKFIFRDTFKQIQNLIELRNDPIKAIKHPLKNFSTGLLGLKALPRKVSSASIERNSCNISDIPQIVNWPDDGGPFVTLPIVYTEDVKNPGIMKSNIGMYRIQLAGNEYELNKEMGLHYQLHRGIGVHQTNANELGVPLKVSIFVGGPPAHSLSAVMPLPEGIPELTFAGALGNRRFRYKYVDGYAVSADADFVICGEVHPNNNKPEGPFGDHLGYYSLVHPFPVLRVAKIYHKKNAIWPFTVVGRPPQEDTSFGQLIHELTGAAIPNEIPGLHEVHAVDASGVHPLLLAIGSERYTPYLEKKEPSELLTIANHILGKGQLSLAKYVLIMDKDDNPHMDIHKVDIFLKHLLERIDLQKDLHFYTNTSIDTLDYSGTSINRGSKLVMAAVGKKKRELKTELNSDFNFPASILNVKVVMPGVLAVQAGTNVTEISTILKELNNHFSMNENLANDFPLWVLCDDANFVSANMNNFLWVTFTRSNPADDIRGIGEFIENKHWGCKGSMIIDARKKTHHAPELVKDPAVEKRVDALGVKGASLYGII